MRARQGVLPIREDPPLYVRTTSLITTADAVRALRGLVADHVQACVTSPPYFGLRDYEVPGQIGCEPTPSEYVDRLVDVFGEVRRVLRPDGLLWLNLGDTFANSWACRRKNVVGNGSLPDGRRGARPNRLVEGLRENSLIGIPWRVALGLQQDGWVLRSEIIWHKPNATPEGRVTRPHRSHEHLFMFCKTPSQVARAKYKYRHVDAFEKTVWEIPTKRAAGGHMAPFPEALVEPCLEASTDPGDVVLDPFVGSGTTAVVAKRMGRHFVGFDIRSDYVAGAVERVDGVVAA